MSDVSDGGFDWLRYMRRALDEVRHSRDEAARAQLRRSASAPDEDWQENYRQTYGAVPEMPWQAGPVGRGGPETREHRPPEVDPGVWRQQQEWTLQREMYFRHFGPGGRDEG